MRIPGFVVAVVFALLSMVSAAVADVLYAVAPPYFLVRFDSGSPAVLQQVLAFDPDFAGGVFVDANADGRYEIVTAPGLGRVAEVRIFDGITGTMLDAFQPYGGFSGGAFVGGARR